MTEKKTTPKKRTKKEDLELKMEIKKEEDKKRAEAMSKAEVNVVSTTPENTISYEQWWMMVNKPANLKPWMKEIVWADFKARGMKKEETKESFDAALRKFGIKF